MNVADVVNDAATADGGKVAAVYYCSVPFYAIYRSERRVRIHYADDAELQARQRAALAVLNPVRGEIDGLLDGLRDSGQPAFVALAERFDRRVADALSIALEGDVAGGGVLLDAVRRDAAEERSSIARLEYLRVATGTMVLVVAVIAAVTLGQAFPPDIWMLWLAAATGTVGAFFSIAVDIRGRQVQPGLRTRDNVADAILRIIVGVIAAVILICLLQSRLVTSFALGEGAAAVKGGSNFSGSLVAVLGFVAGFVERLIPDLLAKAVASTVAPPAPRVVAAPAGAAAIGVAPAPPAAPPPHSPDRDAVPSGPEVPAEPAAAAAAPASRRPRPRPARR